MAAVITFLVAEKLAEFLQSAVLNSTIHTGIKKMESDLRRICKLLEEDPGLEMNNDSLRSWVRDLTDAAQEIEDVIDNFLCGHERGRHRRGCMGSAFVLTFKDSAARWKIVGEMEEKERNVGHILDRMPKEEDFGFEQDSDALVKWLLDVNYEKRQQRCVVGRSGAGKTTLVRKVYNKTAVKDRFPHCFWVGTAVRYPFMLREKITREVTGCSKEELEKNKFEEYMHRKISDTLKGKRYLIVLDINLTYGLTREYEEMKKAFPDETNGSRILLTSNDRKYAGSLLPDEFHELGLLTQEDRSKLFNNTVNHEAKTAAPTILSMLEEIVRMQPELLPLDVVNLGTHLSMECYKTGDRSFDVSDRRTLLEIASKYNNLESSLKLCLLYCSLFPRGFEIPKLRIVQLWIAEGWIPEGNEIRAEEYLEMLSRLGMILVQKRGRHPYFKVKTFRLNSLVWDFAAMNGKQCNLFHSINDLVKSPNSSKVRRLALALDASCNFDGCFSKDSFKSLRSLLCFPSFPQLTVIGDKVSFPSSKFKLLRVLDLEDMDFIGEVEEIGHLVHLRYLGLRRCAALDSLPPSIGNLINLLSLDTRGTQVKSVPTAILKLKKLKYLYMDMDDGSKEEDSLDVSSLEGLRVLSVIRAGPWMENGLAKLTNLRKLGIYGDMHLLENAQNLHNFRTLKSLRFCFGYGDAIPNLQYVLRQCNRNLHSLYLERPLQKLPDHPRDFPYYLRKLCLKSSLLEQDPMPTLEQLEWLEVLKLGCGSFLGKKMVCSAFWFRNLRFLEVNLLNGLEEWTVEERAMRRLERLVIHLCNRLKMLPEGLQHLHTLEELEVAGMPKTFNDRLQHTVGQDWGKIQHLKSVTVDEIQISDSSSSSSTIRSNV